MQTIDEATPFTWHMTTAGHFGEKDFLAGVCTCPFLLASDREAWRCAWMDACLAAINNAECAGDEKAASVLQQYLKRFLDNNPGASS